MHIVLIDDDELSLTLLSHQLVALGYDDIKTFEAGHEAITYIGDNHRIVELVLCDLQMPGMDGVEFVRWLGKAGYENGLIIVSGADERVLQTAERVARGHKLTVCGTLPKPIMLPNLHDLLRKAEKVRIPFVTHPDKPFTAEELKTAIESGQVMNYYQPKVDISTGDFVGVEALARWLHPTEGLVSPKAFISLAEQTGLIGDLTRAVLQQALEQGRRWHESGLTVSVAVNISMNNLSSVRFLDDIYQILGETAFDTQYLVLEITESQLMVDPLSTWEILVRLRLMGISVSIDDFGTGHSSLAQLRDAPFNELKIDHSFVHGAADNKSQRAIIEGSVRMADQLDIKTVAEGIEDQQDWNCIVNVGCDFAQGYFIALPMPATQVESWMELWGKFRPHLSFS